MAHSEYWGILFKVSNTTFIFNSFLTSFSGIRLLTSFLFLAFHKYLSQYEHFSESGFGDAIADFSNDNVNFEMALVRLEESITVIQEGLKNNE